MRMSDTRQWRVTLAICVGMKAPLPCFTDKLPVYVFADGWPAESKRAALRRARELIKLNPGYQFQVEAL
jgi:hypothetical protein